MINEKIKSFLMNENYKEYNSNPLFLGDTEPFFTFSPFLSAQPNFYDKKRDNFFITQECFRYNKIEMIETSPLSVPYQNLTGFYHTNPVSIKEVVIKLKNLFTYLGLDLNNIYVTVNEDHTDNVKLVKDIFPNTIPFVREDMKARNIPYTTNAYYLRFSYLYKKGVVGLSNIVLLNQEGEFSEIDGLIFNDRILFISENLSSVFETEYYTKTKSLLLEEYKFSDSIYTVLSNALAALKLVESGCIIGNNNSGHILKKIVKDAAMAHSTLIKNNDSPISYADVKKMIEQLATDNNISINAANDLSDYWFKFLNNSKKLVDKFVKESKNDFDIMNSLYPTWKDRYGLDEYLIRKYQSNFSHKKITVGFHGSLQNGFWGYLYNNNNIENPFNFYEKKAIEVRESRNQIK